LVTVYLPPPPISSPSQREGEDLERVSQLLFLRKEQDCLPKSSPSLWEGED